MKIAFGTTLKHMPGQAFVAKQDGRVVGAMRMVEWPDCRKMKPLQVLRMLPTLLKAGTLGEINRAMKARSAWVKNDPKKPHWHIDPIGVAPELQGQGIGSKLMEYYCNHVDKLGMAAYHETDSRTENVRFYERFGFKVIAEETIMDIPIWFMWRSARSKAYYSLH
jgi:ribosomal protein S18 acetylase RimI-like enzyme